MPRLRKGSNVQSRAATGTLTLDVEYQGTIVSISCGDGSQDLAWLAKQAEIQLTQSSGEQVNSPYTVFREMSDTSVALL